jgi:cyclophilin family peptidyl-prolyl cis-trans isomerase
MKQIFKYLSIGSLAVVLMTSCSNQSKDTSNNGSFMDSFQSEEVDSIKKEEVIDTSKITPGLIADTTGQTAPVNEKETEVLIKTTLGNIKVKLYNETPLHKANFIKLCKSGFYEDLLFHRVIKDFMIQVGDPTSKNAPANMHLGSGGPGYTIPAEIRPNLKHKRGALAAARMGDEVNPQRASSGSQFYICHQNSNFLDNNYTVFGEVVEGIEIVDRIANTRTAPGDRPVSDIKIISTKVLK